MLYYTCPVVWRHGQVTGQAFPKRQGLGEIAPHPISLRPALRLIAMHKDGV